MADVKLMTLSSQQTIDRSKKTVVSRLKAKDRLWLHLLPDFLIFFGPVAKALNHHFFVISTSGRNLQQHQ
jgi:hypothetical protein